MLKAMPGIPGMMRAETEYAVWGVDILISSIDIGLDVMQPVMLLTPKHLAPSE
jgi:hypothetical protein